MLRIPTDPLKPPGIWNIPYRTAHLLTESILVHICQVRKFGVLVLFDKDHSQRSANPLLMSQVFIEDHIQDFRILYHLWRIENQVDSQRRCPRQ